MSEKLLIGYMNREQFLQEQCKLAPTNDKSILKAEEDLGKVIASYIANIYNDGRGLQITRFEKRYWICFRNPENGEGEKALTDVFLSPEAFEVLIHVALAAFENQTPEGATSQPPQPDSLSPDDHNR